jgi:hypothetical protein
VGSAEIISYVLVLVSQGVLHDSWLILPCVLVLISQTDGRRMADKGQTIDRQDL